MKLLNWMLDAPTEGLLSIKMEKRLWSGFCKWPIHHIYEQLIVLSLEREFGPPLFLFAVHGFASGVLPFRLQAPVLRAHSKNLWLF